MTQPQEPFAKCRVCGKEPGSHCRVHYVAEVTELRAELEAALMLLDRIGEFAHGEDCDAYNACQNGESEDCRFEEDVDECVHVHTSCDCLVWDAATRAKNIRLVLTRTLGNRVSAKATVVK